MHYCNRAFRDGGNEGRLYGSIHYLVYRGKITLPIVTAPVSVDAILPWKPYIGCVGVNLPFLRLGGSHFQMSSDQGSSDCALWPSQVCCSIVNSPQSKNDFYIYKGWGGKIERRIFHDTQTLCEIQILVTINKVLLEYNYARLFTYCLWLLSHDNSRTE